ncbi:hypothetical protein VTK56DRAFT_9210 [Thermocarpiscus australiensis]
MVSGSGTLRVPSRPANAPAGYRTATGTATSQRSKAVPMKVPPKFVDLPCDAGAKSLRSSENYNPSPSTADCDGIVNQILSSSGEFIIAAGSCRVFSYRACQGFFCSLCQTLSTTTDSVGNQLDTVDALCAENCQAGTIAGEDPPQWDAGFAYSGTGLPTYDVC